jgi:uncharacterized protein YegP (UPF0339 family)
MPNPGDPCASPPDTGAKSKSGEFLVCRNNAWERGGEAFLRTDLTVILHDDEGGDLGWSLVNRDAVIVARAPTRFATADMAVQAAQLFVETVELAEFKVHRVDKGWGWRARARGSTVAVTGEVYESPKAAERAIESLRHRMIRADVVGIGAVGSVDLDLEPWLPTSSLEEAAEAEHEEGMDA